MGREQNLKVLISPCVDIGFDNELWESQALATAGYGC